MIDLNVIVDDSTALPTAQGLLAALQGELDRRGIGSDLVGAVLAPGAEYAFDLVPEDGSIIWVRLVGLFPSTGTFPIQDFVADRTGGTTIAQIYELGIVRGFLPPDNADAPEPQQLSDAARLQMADAAAIYTAICSYFKSQSIKYLMGLYVPYGPMGAVVGGSWQVTAGTAF